MASTLCQSIFEKGQARGRTRGRGHPVRQGHHPDPDHWLGVLDAAVATRIRAETSLDTLEAWLNEALYLTDAESARRLAERIGKAAQS